MARSTAQIAAARANGARSRGPVTEEGMAVSSQNALRHGLCARQVALPRCDDRMAFDELRLGLQAAYRPQDAQEQELVTAIAMAAWQVRRAQDLEMQYWDNAIDETALDEGNHLIRHLDDDNGHRLRMLATVMRYQARAETARARAMRDLALYRSGRLHSKPVTTADATTSAQRTNEPETLAAAGDVPASAVPMPAAAVNAAVRSRRYERMNEPKTPMAEGIYALPPELLMALEAMPMPRLRVPLAA